MISGNLKHTKMKMKFLITLVSFSLCSVLSAQIKIGDNPQNIDASSVLELESSGRVLVITRINSQQMNSIVPLQGAVVYNTDEQCLFFYDGAAWLNMCETFGLSFTADPIVNPTSTIVITENGDNRNFEVSEITGANIVDFSISGNDIQNNSITSDKLAPDSVGSEELQDNTVADAEIDYNQVTLNDFNNDAGFITGADIVSAAPNNAITDNGGAFYDDTTLQNDIAANAAAIAADGDTDANNEIQNLALAGNNLTISGANTVDLGVFNNAGTDEQDLTGATLSGANILQIDIENGASATVDLSALSGTGTDNQNLTGAILSPANILQIDIEDGSSATVDLSGLSGTGTDNQQLTITGGNILTLEDGGTVDLNPFLDNTDDQNITNFAFDGLTNVLTITLEDGNTQTVDLTALATGAGTDDQQLTITGGNILTLEDGGTVDLNPFLDNVDTDDQTITNFVFDDLTNILTITLEDGNTQTVDLTALATAAGTDDQVAAEVPFTPTGNTLSVEVQSAIEELQTEIDGISAGGAANPTDELQNLLLNNTELSLTPPAAPNIPIDLDPVFATDAELAALNVDDADADPVNEIQTLTLTGLDVSISGGNTITLPSGDGTETIVNAGPNVAVAGDGSVATPYVISSTDTDDQTLSLVGLDLTIADGNTLTLPTGDGSETIINDSGTVTVAGTGTAVDPYILNSIDTSDGSETVINDSGTITVAGTGTVGDPYILTSLSATDGSETIVNGSATVTVSGTGTAADPYILTSADTSDGSETVINPSTTVTVVGTGTAGDPYILTSLSAADGSETIVNGSATVAVTGTGTAGDPYILNSTGGADGSETIVNGSASVNVAGTGTGADPYILSSPDTSDGSETIINNSGTVTVAGTGTPGDPYILTSTGGADGSETIVNGSATVNVAGTGTGADPYILTSVDTSDGSETIINNSGTVTVAGTGTAGDPYILTSTGGGTVFVDATLSGDGSGGSPLGVTNNGISSIHIADGAISGGAAGQIVDDSITASDLQTDSVDRQEIKSGAVATGEIEDLTILNEDINNSAAIAGSKITPNFNQDVTTTGVFISAGTPLNVPDYVFETYFNGNSKLNDEYEFKNLSEVEAFIKAHNHLPGIKSAKEVQKDGFWNLSKSNLQNLEKIEELFLHTINQEKKINQLETKNQAILEELESLKKELEAIKNAIKEK